MPIFRRPRPGSDDADIVQPEVVQPAEAAEPQLPPSRMRGTEPLYGYVVALELLVVAILNMVITTGKGAPAHPQTGMQIVGVIAPFVLVGLIQLRNRTAVGFAAIVAAFFVTLPKVPSSLAVAHVFALIIPLAYGLIITQRQRRAMGNAMRRGGRRDGTQAGAGRAARGGESRSARSGDARTERRRGRKRSEAEVPSGPRPSARYTPPKTKRGKAAR